MASVTHNIPWRPGKIPRIAPASGVAVSQGQLINSDGTVATKGTAGGSDGIIAEYVALASITATQATNGERIAVGQLLVIENLDLASASVGDPVYLGLLGAPTLTATTDANGDTFQIIGTILSANATSGRAHINLTGVELSQLITGMQKTWAPTFVYTGGTDPTTPTIIAEYTKIGNVAFFLLTWASSDGKATTGVTITLPSASAMSNLPVTAAIVGSQSVNGSYIVADALHPYIDSADDKIKFRNLSTLTNAQAATLSISGWYFTA